jgi:hypothetical protein
MEIACFKIPANLGAGLVLCSAPRLFVKGRRIQVPQWVVLLALLLAILFPAAGHADELTKQMCDAEAASMEQVAKDRDAKKPEAAAHAEQEGETDNKIISLIYQTREFSPEQEQSAIFKVCMETDGFIHLPSASADPDLTTEKLDNSILQAIRINLTH